MITENCIKCYPTEKDIELFKSKFRSSNEVLIILKDAINSKTPFSLVRLGDGENCILAYPELVDLKHHNWVIERALGEGGGLEDRDYLDMRFFLERSIKSSDVVGVYPISNPDPILSSTVPMMLKRGCYRNQVLAIAWINYSWQEEKLYPSLLSGKKIGIISCRNIKSLLEEKLSLEVTRFYFIPEEYQYSNRSSCADTFKVSEMHYPYVFEEVCESINVEFLGQVFLVGAGHLGKYYCHLIKEKGGIAIDVGSLFDVWSGLKTRSAHVEKGRENILDKWKL